VAQHWAGTVAQIWIGANVMQDNKEFLGRALRQFIKNHPFSTALFAEPNDKAQAA
jgi:hypothetical protein